MPRAYFRDHPLPERQRLGVRIVHPENAHALVHPELHGIAQREPQRRHRGLGEEVRIDDVLVFLWRILGVAHRSVRTPAEPVGMLAQPGMIRRALDREIERDLQSRCPSPRPAMRGIHPACRVADEWHHARPPDRRSHRGCRHHLARRAARCCGPCDWSSRSDGSVENTAHRSPSRGSQAGADHIGECPMPCWIVCGGPRKHLVPARKDCLRPIDINRKRWLVTRCEGPVISGLHRRGGFLGQQQGNAICCWQRTKLLRNQCQRGAILARHAVGSRLYQMPAFLDFQRDRLAGRVFG